MENLREGSQKLNHFHTPDRFLLDIIERVDTWIFVFLLSVTDWTDTHTGSEVGDSSGWRQPRLVKLHWHLCEKAHDL